MSTGLSDVREIASELHAAMPPLDAAERRLALALYRLLAEGRPVAPGALAERSGLDAADAAQRLDAWPGVYREGGEVIGFWGLALSEMPHRIRFGGPELRAWCAWDTLFLPELVGRGAEVESACPVTGETISLEVVPGEGVRGVEPETAVLSFLRREEPLDADTIQSFCHFIHFLRDEEAGEEWAARHEDVFLLTLQQGLEVARLVNEARYFAPLR